MKTNTIININQLNPNSIFLLFCFSLALGSCQQPGKNSTGSEYVPDMAHAVSFESNVYDYFYQNRWGSKEDLHKMASPRYPVKGSIPRGEGNSNIVNSNLGLNSHGGRSIPVNGSVPYHYADTEEDRTRAIAEIINNPYPITTAGLDSGKELYNIFCATCHGENGGGAGYLVREDGGKYPVQPANFLADEHVLASNGRYYHAIMYGKNLMGNYKDKISYKERWNVIHYIRSLQAVDKKLAYNEKENTLNAVDVPFANASQKIEVAEEGTLQLSSAEVSSGVPTSAVKGGNIGKQKK